MVAGLPERLIDETNWLLGGAHVPGRPGRARAERVVALKLQGLQNRLAVNPCSSALSASPAPPLPSPASSASSTSTATVYPPVPGSSGGAPSVSPPASPTPFYANCLGWVGCSILGSCDLGDEEWITHAQLAPFAKGRVVPVSHVEAQQAAIAEKKRAVRKQPEVAPTATAESEEPSARLQSASGVVALNPLPYPDWAHPASAAALAQARQVAAAAAASSPSYASASPPPLGGDASSRLFVGGAAGGGGGSVHSVLTSFTPGSFSRLTASAGSPIGVAAPAASGALTSSQPLPSASPTVPTAGATPVGSPRSPESSPQ